MVFFRKGWCNVLFELGGVKGYRISMKRGVYEFFVFRLSGVFFEILFKKS